MKLTLALLASLVLCSCSPLRYKFTEGTTQHFATDADRIKSQLSPAKHISR